MYSSLRLDEWKGDADRFPAVEVPSTHRYVTWARHGKYWPLSPSVPRCPALRRPVLRLTNEDRYGAHRAPSARSDEITGYQVPGLRASPHSSCGTAHRHLGVLTEAVPQPPLNVDTVVRKIAGALTGSSVHEPRRTSPHLTSRSSLVGKARVSGRPDTAEARFRGAH